VCSHTFPPFLGILQGVFYGLGNGGGTVLSGHLYEAIGAQSTFQYFAISSLVVLFIFLIAFPVFDGTQGDYMPVPLTEVQLVENEKTDKTSTNSSKEEDLQQEE